MNVHVAAGGAEAKLREQGYRAPRVKAKPAIQSRAGS